MLFLVPASTIIDEFFLQIEKVFLNLLISAYFYYYVRFTTR